MAPRDTVSEEEMRKLKGCRDVARAWEIQRTCKEGHIKPFLNGRAIVSDLAEAFEIDQRNMVYAARLVDMALLSARAFFSILHVARTIADLDARDVVLRDDIAESFQCHQPLPFEQNTERKISS